MREIRIKAIGEVLQIISEAEFPSGSINVFSVAFTFQNGWENINKSVVFRAGDIQTVPILLGDDGKCVIPHEIFQKPGQIVYAGIYGTFGSEIVRPTNWIKIGTVIQGTEPGEDTAEPPQTNWYGEVVELARQAYETANSVRTDADNGEFDGKDGKSPYIGSDGYWYAYDDDTGEYVKTDTIAGGGR